MAGNRLKRPVFFVGMPRSGTTILFEIFSRHESLGWLSGYSCDYPNFPAMNFLRCLLDNNFISLVGEKKQHGKVRLGNRFYPRPDEAYPFWDKYAESRFSTSYLHQKKAPEEVRLRVRAAVDKVLMWQGKSRFATKLTGPTRIQYLQSIFSDAIFIHVVRDGRSSVNSLLNVGFWKQGGGLESPWWSGGLSDELIKIWRHSGNNAAVLAAIQWRQVLQGAREEAKALSAEQYREVNYEDFTASPHEVLKELFSYCELSDSERAHKYIDSIPPIKNMNHQYKQKMSPGDIELMEKAMGPMLERECG